MIPATMRDAFLERIYDTMRSDSSVFFLSADFGAPVLDRIRAEFPDRFLNVGIAEQNLINIAAGLALEGFRVFAYAIAPFYLRAYEQIRINLSMLAGRGGMNVNLIAVGAGCGYVIAGPSHHCFEDLAAMRLLPGVRVVSPSDSATAAASFELTEQPGIRYFRFDAQRLPLLNGETSVFPSFGFRLLRDDPEPRCVFVSTGYMTHFAERVAELFAGRLRVRHVDLLDFGEPGAELSALLNAPVAASFEEAFIGRGGLDALVRGCLPPRTAFHAFGLPPRFEFAGKDRESTLRKYGLTVEGVAGELSGLLKEEMQ